MYIFSDVHKNNVPASESFKSGIVAERSDDSNTPESSEDLPTQPSEELLDTLSTAQSTEEVVAEASRPSTPPLVTNLMEMGFNRPQINVALERFVQYICT